MPIKTFKELTRRGKLRRLRQLALQALQSYDLEVTGLKALTNHFNTFFRVDTAGGSSYALRVGQAGYRHPDEMLAELALLKYISHNSAIVVPEPIPPKGAGQNLTNRWIVPINREGVPETRYCILFKWMEGRDVPKKPAGRTIYKLGQLTARLHDLADNFKLSPGLNCRRMDKVWPLGEPGLIYRQEPNELFTATRQDLMRRAAERVQAALDMLYSKPGELRFLHADMHPGNARLYRGELRMLDFDDSQWCYPVQDVAISLYHMRRLPNFPELREAFKQGYCSQRAWPETYEGQVDTLITARLLELWGYLLRKPEAATLPDMPIRLAQAEEHLANWLGR